MARVPRWHAEVHYVTDTGILVVPHDFEEIHELELAIERGPHWNAIDHIRMTIQRQTDEGPLTVEEARPL